MESAIIRKSGIVILTEINGTKQMPVMGTHITRSKIQNKAMIMRTYPEREEFLLDYHFAIAYSIILNKNSNPETDFLFPDFEEKVNYGVGATRKTKTETSDLYRAYADQLIKIADKYGSVVMEDDDEFDEDDKKYIVCVPKQYRGYGGRKKAANTMSDFLDFHIWSFRMGWMVRNMHSAFDYLFNSASKDGM